MKYGMREITVASSYNTVQDNIFLLLIRVWIVGNKKKSIVLGSVNCGQKGPIKQQYIQLVNKKAPYFPFFTEKGKVFGAKKAQENAECHIM